MESFRQGLRELGFVEGQNLVIELRYPRSGLHQLPELAAELVRLKVDVIQASGDLAPRVAQQATTTIPIVAMSDDILGAGLIAGLSRPGGNITGLTIFSPELSAKRLELLKEIVPQLSRVTAVSDPAARTSQVAMTEAAARSAESQVASPGGAASRGRGRGDPRRTQLAGGGDYILSSPFLASLYQEIIGFAAEYRLPAIYQWKEHAEAGGLISYGPSLAAMFRQAAGLVVKVLKGATARRAAGRSNQPRSSSWRSISGPPRRLV